MKRFLLVSVLLACASLFLVLPALAEGNDPPVLCLPGIYYDQPDDCLIAGPSTYLTQMARKGITFPLAPMSATPIDPLLSQVSNRYGKVNRENAPIYNSVDEALKGKRGASTRAINSSFSYISYSEEQIVNGKRFFSIASGGWMTNGDVSRIGALPHEHGYTFSETPAYTIGFVLNFVEPDLTQTKRTPGEGANDYTGHTLKNYQAVPIYDVQHVKDMDWFMIAPDEWLPQRLVVRVTPNTTPPPDITGDRWIEVNLLEQTLAVYDHRQLVFATVVATGVDQTWTRPGTFQIKQKLQSTLMRGLLDNGGDAYYLEDVPWTMYFDGARALHGAYWRAKMGYPQSHGCVNMTVGDAHWVFDWAKEGDWVYVWDPSGKTPTDPSLYTGGAP